METSDLLRPVQYRTIIIRKGMTGKRVLVTFGGVTRSKTKITGGYE